MTELLPCPFCGGLDIRYTSPDGWMHTKCMICRAQGPLVDPEGNRGENAQETLRIRADRAYELWNTRINPLKEGGE